MSNVMPIPPPRKPRDPDARGQLVVYGARCTWWDYIENAGSRPTQPFTHFDRFGRPTHTTPSPPLPVCPHCGSPLFQMSDEQWRRGVNTYAEKKPGYHDLVGFMKGKCFPNMSAAEAAYAATRTVQ